MKGPSVTLPPRTTAPAGSRPSPGISSFSNFLIQAFQAAYCACICSGEEGLAGQPAAAKRYRHRNLILVVDINSSSGRVPPEGPRALRPQDARACSDWTRSEAKILAPGAGISDPVLRESGSGAAADRVTA